MSSRAEYLPATQGTARTLLPEPVGVDSLTLDELEQNYIMQVLHKTQWHLEGNQGAAMLLGLNPTTLRVRMRKYGILA
jgi:DNA-binding protein Fis